MYRLILILIALIWANGSPGWLPSVVAQTLSVGIGELLRHRIEAAGSPPKIMVGEESIYDSITLPLFYERRTYQLAWSNDDGPLPQVDALIKAIREADLEGLRPEDYHLAKIEATLQGVRQNQDKTKLNPDRLIDLDLLLTDAFLTYGSHLLAGRVNPATVDAEWLAERREADLAQVLQTAIVANQIEEALKALLPPYPGYARLRDALAHYRDLAEKGGWQQVPDGPKLQMGDCDERVPALWTRLMVTGDLEPVLQEDATLFDEVLDQAVRRFQKRHGLAVDGVVGPATLAALNVSAEKRVRQIEVNMERWRWLPQDLGGHHILVNIAGFELNVVENGQPVMTMRVVMGKQDRPTPVFSGALTYLVLCPYWQVPPTIAIKDKLPQIRKEPGYLTRKKIKVFQGGEAIDPRTINWSEVTAKNFNYRFRQNPGPKNALGRVKFVFPNPFNIILHDTPDRELFIRNVRTFSSGCIRVEKPIELAEYVMRGDPQWTREKILTTINKWVERTVWLPEPIPVHLLYFTAWVDAEGTLQFRNDIYGRDKRLDEALRQKRSTPAYASIERE